MKVNSLWRIALALVVFMLASPTAFADFLGTFRNTHYYLVLEEEYAHLPKDDVITDMKGKVLARVSTRFRKAADIEGSAKLEDGRVINFAAKIDGRIRYRFSPNPYGDGVGICALEPFRTVAVDRTRIPLGSWVKIEETIGMRLPDGTIHDGLWRAEDVGGAIKKDRIDLFIGERRHNPYLSAHGIRHLQPLTIHLVEEPAEGNCTNRALTPHP